MSRILLFSAALLALASPMAAKAQDIDGIAGTGGIFLFKDGTPLFPLPGMTIQNSVPLGFDFQRGGYPLLQGQIILDRHPGNVIKAHPGELLFGRYRVVNTSISDLKMLFTRAQHIDAWFVEVNDDPNFKPVALNRMWEKDDLNGYKITSNGVTRWGYNLSGQIVRRGRYAEWPLIKFITVPKEAKPGQVYDLCCAVTPNAYPTGAILNRDGFPLETFGWTKIRVYIE